MLLSSHADDDAAQSCWQWRRRCDLVVARYHYRVMLVTVLLSHASDGTVERLCRGTMSLPSHDGDDVAESCW
jgi:hypothetical protein